MRFVSLMALLGLVGFAQASWSGGKKKAVDAEGNCVPELISENTRLYGEIEGFDKESALIEKQLKSKDPGSQKLGLEGLKKLSEKAKTTRKAIQIFGDTFGKEAACKAQVKKGGKVKVIMLKVGESVTSLDKLAAAYIKMVDDYLKLQGATK